MGSAALEGLEGIKKIEKAFKNSQEINRVYYDPALITIEEMKNALRKAKTYRGIVR